MQFTNILHSGFWKYLINWIDLILCNGLAGYGCLHTTERFCKSRRFTKKYVNINVFRSPLPPVAAQVNRLQRTSECFWKLPFLAVSWGSRHLILCSQSVLLALSFLCWEPAQLCSHLCETSSPTSVKLHLPRACWVLCVSWERLAARLAHAHLHFLYSGCFCMF